MHDSLYAIIGENIFLVESEVEKIIEKIDVEPFNILSYDLEEAELQEFLQEITTVSLLSDNKVIKVKNPWFFYESKNEDLTSLIKYFKNPKHDTVVIFMLTEEINDEMLISKEAKKFVRFERVESLKVEEYPTYVKNYFERLGYKIEKEAIVELLNRVENNYQKLHGELDKLELLALDSKSITVKDVELLVPRNLEDNIFELSTAVIEKNKTKAINAYYDLMNKNVDPVTIISNLASKLKETITTKHLLSKGLNQQSVAEYFSVSSGRAYYMVKNANIQNFVELEKSFYSLVELDFKIKSGQIDKKLGLELWLLEGFDAKR